MKILIVDDQESICRLIKSQIETWTFGSAQVMIGRTDVEVMEIVETFVPDIALVDLYLNSYEKAGLDVLRMLRKNFPGTEVIIISGKGALEDAVAALNLGAYGYLIKPFNITVLQHMFEEAAEKVRLKGIIEANKRKVEIIESIDDYVFTLNYEGFFGEPLQPLRTGVMAFNYKDLHFRNVFPSHVSYLLEEAILVVEKTRGYDQFEYSMTVDGALRWFNAKVTGRWDASKKFEGVTCVVRDITDRKRMEDELLEAKEIAMASNIVKNQYLTNMSNEIHTPLTDAAEKLGELEKSELSMEQLSLVINAQQNIRLVLKILEQGGLLTKQGASGDKDNPRKAKPDGGDVKKLRIIIADDYIINQIFVEEILRSMGHETVTVENGLQVLDKLEKKDFDLILMDLQMPELDGLETTREIRNRKWDKSNIPIIALTAYASELEISECREAGMNSFVSKPVDVISLGEKIERVLSHPGEWIGKKETFGKMFDKEEALPSSTIYIPMTEAFLSNYIEQLNDIEKSVAEKDGAGLRSSAHKLAGATSYFSKTIESALRELEKLGKQGQMESVEEKFEVLQHKFSQLKDELTEFLKKERSNE